MEANDRLLAQFLAVLNPLMKYKFIPIDERDETTTLLRRTVSIVHFMNYLLFIYWIGISLSCSHTTRDEHHLLAYPMHRMLGVPRLSSIQYTPTITHRAGQGLRDWGAHFEMQMLIARLMRFLGWQGVSPKMAHLMLKSNHISESHSRHWRALFIGRWALAHVTNDTDLTGVLYLL